jgi:hypothetical protein
MLRKLTIGVAGLLVLLVAIYAILNSIYNKNTAPAERILESIENSTRNYYGQVQSGGFNYDTEQSILNTRVLDYQQLTQWAIRPHIKRRFDGILAEAKKALASAQEMELSSQQARKEGEATAEAAIQEMRENQRRSNEQQ